MSRKCADDRRELQNQEKLFKELQAQKEHLLQRLSQMPGNEEIKKSENLSRLASKLKQFDLEMQSIASQQSDVDSQHELVLQTLRKEHAKELQGLNTKHEEQLQQEEEKYAQKKQELQTQQATCQKNREAVAEDIRTQGDECTFQSWQPREEAEESSETSDSQSASSEDESLPHAQAPGKSARTETEKIHPPPLKRKSPATEKLPPPPTGIPAKREPKQSQRSKSRSVARRKSRSVRSDCGRSRRRGDRARGSEHRADSRGYRSRSCGVRKRRRGHSPSLRPRRSPKRRHCEDVDLPPAMKSSVIQMVIEDTPPKELFYWMDHVNTGKIVVLIYIGRNATALENKLAPVFENNKKYLIRHGKGYMMLANTSYYSEAVPKSELGENGCVYAATLFKGTPEQSHNIAVAVMTTAHDASNDHARTFVTQCVHKMHVDRCHLCVCWLPGELSLYKALFTKRDVAIVLETFRDGNSVSTLPMYIAVLNGVDVNRRKRITMRTLSDKEHVFRAHLRPWKGVLDLTEKGGLDRDTQGLQRRGRGK